MRTSFLIFLALLAYFSVETVSSKLYPLGPTFAIITVFVLPPNESCSNLVSLESLYGTWDAFGFTRVCMTNPNVVNDKLILMACYLYFPVTPVFDCLSLPARSTKFNFPALVIILPLTYYWFSIIMVNIECDLDEVAFICVSATTRWLLPVLYLCVIYF